MTDGSYNGWWAVTLVAVVVVLSMVGGSAFVAGPAQATAPETIDNIGDEVIYIGQSVRVNVSDEFDVDEDDQMFFYEIEQGEVASTVQTPDVDENKTVVLETDRIDPGDGPLFALNNQSGLGGHIEFTVIEQEFEADWEQDTVTGDDEGVALEFDSNRDDYNVTVSADGLEYDELNATFVHNGSDLEEVTDADHLPLDRLGYDRDDGDGVEELRDDGYITLDLAGSDDLEAELVANVTNLDDAVGLPDRGEYDFEVLVTDTIAGDEATLDVGELRATFDEELYTSPAGDLVEVTVELEATDEAWIQFGDEDAGFVDIVYVADDSDSGQATFVANTRLVGTDHSNIDGVNPGDTDVVYYSEDDTVESYIHDYEIANQGSNVGNAKFFDGSDLQTATELDFDEYLVELEALSPGDDPHEQLARPLQPVDYSLVADRRHHFVAEDGETSVDDQIGSAELDLVQPSVRDVTTYTGPGGDADDVLEVDDLREDLTERDAVAIGDRAVIGFETTGLVGSMATIDYVENDNDITEGVTEGFSPNVLSKLAVESSEWETDGIRFRFDGPEQPNREANTLALDTAADRDAFVLTELQHAETDPGYLYVVVDSDSEPFDTDLEDGETFDVELEYLGADERYQFDESGDVFGGVGDDRDDPAFPYYRGGFSATAETPMTFETPSVTFDRTDDGTVQVAPEEDAVISGQTNVAPGTQASVAVRLPPPEGSLPDEDPSFLEREAVAIEPDGSFTAELDLENRVLGEAADVVFAVEREPIATVDGQFSDIDDVRAPFFEATVDVPDAVDPGTSITVNATVRNVGDDGGSGDFRLMVDDDVETSESIDLDPGEETTIETTVDAGDEDGTIDFIASTPDEATSSTVVVGTGGDTGSTADDTDDSADDTGGEPESIEDDPDEGMIGGAIPGFGAGLAALALVLSLVVGRIAADRGGGDGSRNESSTGKN